MKRLILALPALYFLSGCALFTIRPTPILSLEEARAIVHSIAQAETKIEQFFATGSLLIIENQEETRLGFFWAGTRNPLRIKIELTHPWGGQVMEALVSEQQLMVKDHVKKRSYRGPWNQSPIAEAFPAFFSNEGLWMLLCGRVPLLEHDQLKAKGADKILLLDKKGRTVQVIGIDKKRGLPIWSTYPNPDLKLRFSYSKKTQDIPLAKGVQIEFADEGHSISIQFRNLVHNKPIPEEVFTLPME